jgi:hypothetical protein
VVSVEEGLDFIKKNSLFTGNWEQRRAKRKVRVGQILSFIGKTFNPALCTGVRHEINFGKFDQWAKQHCPDGWRRQASRWLDEYGIAHTRQRSRTVADWQFVSLFLSITEYLVQHDKNEDDSVPSAQGKDGRRQRVTRVVTFKARDAQRARAALAALGKDAPGRPTELRLVERRAKKKERLEEIKGRVKMTRPDDVIRLFHCMLQNLERSADIRPGTVNLVLTDNRLTEPGA